MDVGGQTINTAAAIGRMFLIMVAEFAELERNLNFCGEVFQVGGLSRCLRLLNG